MALINLIPGKMREILLNHQIKYPNLFLMDEVRLKMHLRGEYAQVSMIDEALRTRFWAEYDRAVTEGKEKMSMESVWSNVTAHEVWDRYIHLPEKMAWLMCPPALYDAKQNALLSFAIDEVANILEQPHVVNNRVDAKLATLKFNVFKYLDERVHGSTVQRIDQRIDQRTQTIAEHRMVVAEAHMETEDNLIDRIKKLERKEREVMHVPDTKAISEAISEKVSPETKTDIVIPEPIDVTQKIDITGERVPGMSAPELQPNKSRAIPVHPTTLQPVHPDLNDPNKNHVKKYGGLVAD